MDFSTGPDVPSDDGTTTVARTSKTVDERAFPVVTDDSRDALLTEFGKDTLRDRYLLPGEELPGPVRARRRGLCRRRRTMPSASTIISRSCGSCRRPRCCRTAAPAAACRSAAISTRSDSLEGIVGTWNENVWLASRGGGIGTYWGSVRGIGEPVGLNGKTSGIIPFVRVMDSLTLAISQGSLRRGSAACYLDVSHPEIEEFLEIRKPSGDFNRKALEPPPRRAHHRRVHGSGARRRRIHAAQPQGRVACAPRSMRAPCSRSWSRPASRPASPTSSSSTR